MIDNMTAEIVSLFPTGSDADETVRQTIKGLMEGRGYKAKTLAPLVGMTVATLYRRFSGHGSQQAFTAGEVASIARFFDVPIERIYDGLGGAFVPPQPPDGGVVDTCRYRHLTLAAA